MVIISLELTRVNPDRNIFSINVELTSTFFYSTSHSPNFKFICMFPLADQTAGPNGLAFFVDTHGPWVAWE